MKAPARRGDIPFVGWVSQLPVVGACKSPTIKEQVMSQSTSSQSGGVGFTGLLTIAFIVLKLTGVIAWSWLWVLSPLWIGLAVVLALGVVALVGFGIFKGVKAVRR